MGTARVEQQRTRLSRRALVAPFAGTIVGLEVDPGDSVRPGQILMRVHSDVRQVRFVGHGEQVVHERHVLFVRLGNADRRVDGGDLRVVVRLGFLNTALDFADVVEVLPQARAVPRTQSLL